jgi:hypothetical protein
MISKNLRFDLPGCTRLALSLGHSSFCKGVNSFRIPLGNLLQIAIMFWASD